MACLNKEDGKYYRIHWKFKVTVGPKTGQTFEGSVYLGRCTRAAATNPHNLRHTFATWLARSTANVSLIQKVLGHMNKRKEPPGALDGKDVGLEQMRAFAAAATTFHEARLWDELSDDDLIEIVQPTPPSGMRYASVLGHGGETFGLAFFDSLKDYEKMRSASTPGRFWAKNGAWSLTFGDITELPFADADLWEDHDLPLAGPGAYPCALWFGPKREIRRPSAHEVEFLAGLLRALAETTSKDMDAGRWLRVVVVGGQAIEYRLAMANEADEPAEKTLRSDTVVDHQHLRRAMEKGLANLQRVMAEHEFASLEEANAFIQANLNSNEPLEVAPRTPLEQAQELMYDAWDATSRRRRMLARQALAICPDCAERASNERRPPAAAPPRRNLVR